MMMPTTATTKTTTTATMATTTTAGIQESKTARVKEPSTATKLPSARKRLCMHARAPTMHACPHARCASARNELTHERTTATHKGMAGP